MPHVLAEAPEPPEADQQPPQAPKANQQPQQLTITNSTLFYFFLSVYLIIIRMIRQRRLNDLDITPLVTPLHSMLPL